MELADHQKFTMATDVNVFFVDPKVLGSAEQARTPMVCSASISPRALHWPGFGNRILSLNG